MIFAFYFYSLSLSYSTFFFHLHRSLPKKSLARLWHDEFGRIMVSHFWSFLYLFSSWVPLFLKVFSRLKEPPVLTSLSPQEGFVLWMFFSRAYVLFFPNSNKIFPNNNLNVPSLKHFQEIHELSSRLKLNKISLFSFLQNKWKKFSNFEFPWPRFSSLKLT